MMGDAAAEDVSKDDKTICKYLNTFKEVISATSGKDETETREGPECEHESKKISQVNCDTHTHGEKSFKCADCSFVTFSLQEFEAHVVTHGSEGLYQCMECAENFSYKQLLTQHTNFYHESKYVTLSNGKDQKCPECGKTFRFHENLVRHAAIHDPDASPEKREAAMQIGRPKEPDEPQDGEEDELSNEENIGNSQTPLVAGGPDDIVTVVPSDIDPGQLNYNLFVTPMEGLETEAETNAAEFLTVDVKITDEETNVFNMPSDDSAVEYSCPHCHYTSSKRYLLSRHMKCHADERPHTCKECGRQFKTVTSLQNHMNTHTQTKPHPCRECDSAFTTSGELVRHIRYKHTHEKPHQCTECDYASVELSKLKRHMRLHTGKYSSSYQCPHCPHTSSDTHKLKVHLRKHTGEKPYECDICQARFTQSSSLKTHLRIHSENRPTYQCTYCPVTCGRKTDLRIHIQKLHSSDKMLTCKQCGKVFKDRYSFKMHRKTHGGEKSFECADCPFVTISLKQFEAHVVTHGNEGFYQCKECDENFSHKQLLMQHFNCCHESKYTSLSSKTKDIKCPECGKAFRYHENMIRHRAIHDADASPEKQEEAMQIGRPKEPGELQDGEEEDQSNNEEIGEND